MHNADRQRGSVIVTTALALLFLLGFMGLALDFGHLFIVKTELQTAVDSCALAAAGELNGASDALARATNAGKAAGNLNKVNFQGGAAGIVDADIAFSDSLIGSYSSAFAPVANAKYAKCTRSKSGMAPWLLQAMGAFAGDAALGATQGVAAFAVATLAPSQTACALPVQVRPKVGGTAPNYGYTPGEWIPSLYDEGQGNQAPLPGHFGWANLDGSTNAAETVREMLGNGYCGIGIGDTIGTTGAKVAISTAWNSRFGLYKSGAGNPTIDTAAPDATGYSYTAKNWPSQFNAKGDFLTRRADFRSYGDTVDRVSAGDSITGLNLPGAYKNSDMATHAAGPRALATHGGTRRLLPAPIVVDSVVEDWACVLMLHPIDKPNTTVYLEFVGNAKAPGSPCASSGLPGGAAGPLVPVLVQ